MPGSTGNENDQMEVDQPDLMRVKFLREKCRSLMAELKNLRELDDESNSPVVIQADIAELEKVRFEFCDSSVDLLTLTTDTTEKNTIEQERAEFLREVKRLRNLLLGRLPEAPNPTSAQSTSGAAMRLPKINLPTFDGDFGKWVEYKALFQSLVLKRSDLDDTSKFHYLRASLSGSALSQIQMLPIEEVYFENAWNILVGYYDDPFNEANLHLRELHNAKNMTSYAFAERSKGLRDLIITFRQHATGLQTLFRNKPDIDPVSQVMIYWFLQKTDKRVRFEWNREVKRQNKLPNFDEFVQFVDSLCSAEEQASENSKAIVPKTADSAKADGRKNMKITKNFAGAATSSSSSAGKRCAYCQGSGHYITSCNQFKELPSSDRLRVVAEKKLCVYCLRPKCQPARCFRRPCRTCQQGHNTLLHVEGKNLPHFIAANSLFCHLSREPILATAIVTAFSKDNSLKIDSRALLDQGSQINIISKELASKLNLPTFHEPSSIIGIGNQENESQLTVNITIGSKYSQLTLSLPCVVMNEIVSLVPSSSIPINNWTIPQRLQLADPYFNIPASIDILLGSPIFWSVLKSNQFRIGNNLPKLRETEFGWIIADDLRHSRVDTSKSLVSLQQSRCDLRALIERFWTIEESPILDVIIKSPSTFDPENFFQSTVSKSEDGRFIVQLPFVESSDKLGDSKALTLKRFMQLENSLSRKPDLKSKVSKIIKEYQSLGHLKKVNHNDSESAVSYYVPYHVVIKESATSTRERVVFDFSMKSTSGVSLNNILSKGTVIQPDLISIVLRFRMQKYVFTADIVKMYRQIWVEQSQRSFQRIFWRDSIHDPVDIFELQTVTFGMNCSPYLATRALKKIGDDLPDDLHLVKTSILNDFYVDNCLCGSNDLDTAKSLRDTLTKALKNSGFELSKWSANHDALISDIPTDQRESQFPLFIGDKHTIKTLGILWTPSEDVFRVWLHSQDLSTIFTKRQVLSAIAAIYDIMGLINPVICKGKIIMQNIWKCKSPANSKKSLGWDEKLPDDILSSWLEFSSRLHHLNSRTIPRFIFSNLDSLPEFVEIHGFCDASESAYGAVLFVRAGSKNSITVNLLCSKSRVAPIKTQTIPRLELCGALLLSELVSNVLSYMNSRVTINLVRLWTDSTIVLSWLSKPASSWQPFVANRVQRIHHLTSDFVWDHVKGSENPADLLSRGCNADKFIMNQLWWNGPEWLSSSSNPWGSTVVFNTPEPNLPEQKRLIRSAVFTTFRKYLDFNIFSRYSDFITLLRITSLLLRFFHNLKNPKEKKSGFLTTRELQLALERLVWLSQRQTFVSEINQLTHNRAISTSSKLLSLSPFIDANGILRVGGRLSQSNLVYDQKHPMLLSHHHQLSELIVQHEHLRLLHAGQRLVKSSIRQRFWILRLDNLIRNCVKQCVKCIRFKAGSHSQYMANLPRSRVTPHRPFSICGVDYAGPFPYVVFRGRGRRQVLKSYISLFVCFATKAIHLELVADMSTPAFLAALDRFVNRRGLPSEVHSDNGSNFIGAAAELEEFFSNNRNREIIQHYCTTKNIDWKFIPPYSPSFGGLWESGVKCMKQHLYSSIGTSCLTFEQLSTLCTSVEACLNSRPLYAESLDPSDIEALTPGHFLIGQAITSLPKPDLSGVPQNRLKYWDEVQQKVQSFWKRWSAEYLNTLQQRYKWRIEKDDMKIGEIVLIKESNSPPTKWPLAKIIELHPGSDGHVRVVTLETATSSSVKRPISKIIPLHIP